MIEYLVGLLRAAAVVYASWLLATHVLVPAVQRQSARALVRAKRSE